MKPLSNGVISVEFDYSWVIDGNPLTVREYAMSSSSHGWMVAATKYAQKAGGALVLKADGSMTVFTRLQSGKIRRKTYAPNRWKWSNREELLKQRG